MQSLSPKELAQAIGVSESSVKRWVDEGLLDAGRTVGGHRRIALREAVRYVRHAGLPVIQPQVLGLADLGAVPAGASEPAMEAALVDALKLGNAQRARGIVLALFLAGKNVADLCDGPLVAALQAVGDLWRHGPEGVFIEHRAVEIAAAALHQLRNLLPASSGEAPVAIGGALEDDPYALPTLMVATVLEAAGWNAANLGPNLPTAALLAAVKVHQPALVWISCSVEAVAKKREAELRKTGVLLAQRGIKLIVGGRAWKSRSWDIHSGITAAGSMAEVAAFAQGLVAARTAKSKASR